MADNTGAYVTYEQLIKELFISGSSLVTSEDTTLSAKVIDAGGDKFDLKNVQTLCKKCDKEKTSSDLKKIAKQRKIEKLQKKHGVLYVD